LANFRNSASLDVQSGFHSNEALTNFYCFPTDIAFLSSQISLFLRRINGKNEKQKLGNLWRYSVVDDFLELLVCMG